MVVQQVVPHIALVACMSHLSAFLVSLPSDDVVQHVPVFGMWVPPGYLNSLGFAKHGVE